MDKIEKIIWTQDGIDSLESIVSFIADDSVFYASHFAKNIVVEIEKLIKFPNLGRMVPEYSNVFIRELIYQGYRIVYQIRETIIYVALVVHGSHMLPVDLNL